MIALSGYTITKTIYESSNAIVYRSRREDDDLPVILKTLQTDHPSSDEVAKFRHEYEIVRQLDAPGIAKDYGLETCQHRPVLIREDFGAVSLQDFIPADGLELRMFLDIALQLAEALTVIHQQNIIHKDIKPGNVVINPDTGVVKIIDFGIASRLSHETRRFRPLGKLEGTLAYMSPEQTGRMNRTLDARSDVYSLGVTLYEMICGHLPFKAAEALEIVHSHIARQPETPQQVKSSIPAVVSEMIMKLLAKSAEDRYQSAQGLKADLLACRQRLTGNGQIAAFPLAQQDVSGQFRIPQTLYGREREIETLLAAFERVSAPSDAGSGKELLLVAGPAGVGKSALLGEVHKPITQQHGYFLAGKYDQYHRNIPYSALIHAFGQFVDHLLTESAAQLAAWKTRILEAVGQNGQVLIDVIPALERILGPQPAVAALGPMEARNRFTYLFQNFLMAISRPEHPLTIFLDDLQWADAASLNLLHTLMMGSETRCLLVLGAYRDNEVDATHLLTGTLEQMRKDQAAVSTMTLGKLSHTDVNHLLADTLHCATTRTAALAELVSRKTGGNAFFTIQFVQTLYDEALVNFDAQQQTWQWDLDRIRAQAITENVVELLMGNIEKMSPNTQEVLTVAACIGSQFDLHTLATLCGQSLPQTFQRLWPAINGEFIIPLDETYNMCVTDELAQSPDVNPQFSFLHDRVKEAAYLLIDETRTTQLHLRIGRLLLGARSVENIDEGLFVLVEHLNAGRSLIEDEIEIVTLATLNLHAGKKAKASNAYQAAAQYLKMGRSLLGDESWDFHHDLTFNLYKESAECAYLLGSFDESGQMFELAFERSVSDAERGQLYLIRLAQLVTQAKFAEAIREGLQGLQMFGLELPDTASQDEITRFFERELTRYQQQWEGKAISDLAHLPLNADLQANLVMAILSLILDCAFNAIPQYLGVLTITMINYSIAHGNTRMAPFGYMWHGVLLCVGFHDYESAAQFATMAVNLNEDTIQNARLTSKLLMLGGSIDYLKNPLRGKSAIAVRAYQAALESGDFLYAAFSATHKVMGDLSAGLPLSEVVANSETPVTIIQKVNNVLIYNLAQVFIGFALNLQGNTEHQDSLDHVHFYESDFRQQYATLAGPNIMALLDYCRLRIAYLFEDTARALSILPDIQLGAVDVQVEGEDIRFYGSLALLRAYPEAGKEERKQYDEMIEQYHDVIARLAQSCPVNFLAHDLMICAERAHIADQKIEAMELYDQAIVAARESQLLHNEALANELAAKFWLAQGKQKFAALYMTEAHYLYSRWGASAKVTDLEQRYPELFVRSAADSRMSSSTFAEQLDLGAVLKASQAISGELRLEKLLAALMQIIIEYAGAENGLFLLKADEQLTIEASICSDSGEVAILNSVPVEQSRQLPTAIVNYVSRAAEHVVLHDAAREGAFAQDPYVVAFQPKSILCVPVCYQDTVVGVLYLENNLTTHAFTEEHLAILNVLVAQAAISLENARLFEKSTQGEETLKAMNRELQDQNTFTNTLINLSPDVIYIYDIVDRKNIFSNRGIQRTLGYSEEELKAMGASLISSLMHPDDFRHYRQTVLPKYAQLRDEETFEHEYRMRHNDGTWRWLRSEELIFMRLPDGSPRQIFGMLSDITSRKRAEQLLGLQRDLALALSTENRIQRVFDLLLEHLLQIEEFDCGGVYLVDEATGALDLITHRGLPQQFIEQAAHYDANTPQTQYVMQKIPLYSSHKGALSEPPHELSREEGLQPLAVIPIIFEGQVLAALNLASHTYNTIPVNVRKAVETVATRHIGEVLARIKTEMALQALNVELEQRVQQRTADLEAANRELKDFAYVASHDLKAPLRGISRLAFWLVDDYAEAFDAEGQEMARLLIGRVKRMDELIDGILQYSRIGRIVQEAVPIDLDRLLPEIVDSLSLPEHITVSITEPLPVIVADTTRIMQVFQNLIGNAIKFINKPQGDIRIGCLDQHDRWQFSVADNGPGIREQDYERIFKIFQTLTPRDQQENTGVGLAIVKKIVEFYQGRIWVESTIGEGSVFFFTLPKEIYDGP